MGPGLDVVFSGRAPVRKVRNLWVPLQSNSGQATTHLEKAVIFPCFPTKAGFTRPIRGLFDGTTPDPEGCSMKAVPENSVRLNSPQTATPPGSVPADADAASLDRVGHRLRAAYAGTLEEPLPVRLADLLTRFGERERSRGDD